MSHSHAEIQKHVRTYIAVFVALLALTVVTVGVSYLHLSTVPAIILALVVASIKGTLVAGFFMLLLSEKKAVYGALLLTAIFFVAVMVLPVAQYLDVFAGIKH